MRKHQLLHYDMHILGLSCILVLNFIVFFFLSVSSAFPRRSDSGVRMKIKQARKKVGGLRRALSTIPPWILFLLSLFFICTSSPRGRRRNGRGGGGRKVRKWLSQSHSLFPFLPIPYPFRCLLRRLLRFSTWMPATGYSLIIMYYHTLKERKGQ